MNTPPIVSTEEWDAARKTLLVKEKQLTRARDALAGERRRMPWLAVEKEYRAFSSSPACSAGPSTPAAAARTWPTRSRTRPT